MIRSAILLLAIFSPVAAQDPPPPPVLTGRVFLLAQGGNGRVEAPTRLGVETLWTGTALLSGRFEFEVRLGAEHYRVYSSPRALRPGKTALKTLLPPLGELRSDFREVQLWFHTAEKSWDLGEHVLSDPTNQYSQVHRMGLVLGSELTQQGPVPGSLAGRGQQYQDATAFLLTTGIFGASYLCGVETLEASALPTTSVELFQYDVLVVAGDGFLQLGEAQLWDLRCWVLAGGRLLVFPLPGLRDVHLAFLDDLRLQAGSDDAFEFDEFGGMTSEGRQLVCGLGGLWVEPVIPDVRDPATRQDWQRRGRFLWELSLDLQIVDQALVSAEGEIGAFLLPDSVTLVPTSVILAVLAGFLFLIGPFDYWVLGIFARRRWTWLTFPMWTLLAGGVLYGVSEQYLGSTTHSRHLVVVDLGEGGEVVKVTHSELLFVGRSQDIERRYQESVVVPHSVGQTGRSTVVRDLVYRGDLPENYTVSFRASQWSPVLLSRTMLPQVDGALYGLDLADAEMPLDWSDLEFPPTSAAAEGFFPEGTRVGSCGEHPWRWATGGELADREFALYVALARFSNATPTGGLEEGDLRGRVGDEPLILAHRRIGDVDWIFRHRHPEDAR